MPLTQKQFEELRASLIAKKQTPQKEGFVSGIRNAFNSRQNAAADSQLDSISGKQSLGSGVLQTVGQGAGFVGDIAMEGIKTVVPDSIEQKISSSVQKITSTKPVQDVLASFTSWATRHPEAAKNLDAVVDIASLIPVGKGVAVGTDIAGKTAATTAGKSLSTVGKVVENTGKVTKGGGELIYKTAITPNVKEAERLLKYRADTPFLERVKGSGNKPLTRADTAFEQGIKGTQTMIGVQARQKSKELYNKKIGPAIENSTEIVTKDEMFQPIVDRINKTADPTRKKGLIESFESLREDYKDMGNLSLKEAQSLKSELDDFTPDKVFRGKQVSNEDVIIRNDIANAIRQKTYSSFKDQNIRKDYLDYGNLKELEKVGVKAISEAGTKGGFGGFWSTMWDIATTPIKTVGGRTLYRVGDKLEFTGESGIKKFGDFLQSKGFKRKN